MPMATPGAWAGIAGQANVRTTLSRARDERTRIEAEGTCGEGKRRYLAIQSWESLFQGKNYDQERKNLHMHRWYHKPKIWKRLKNFGLALAATSIIGSCESCIPNLQPIPPQITLKCTRKFC